MRRVLLVGTVLVCLQFVVGCTASRASRDLGWLRGRPVLVVAEDAPNSDTAEAVESALERALALAPIRIHPTSADPPLRRVLSESADRVHAARGAAEERRIPWLLVRGRSEARIENARGGAVRWSTRLQGSGDRDRKLAGRLTRRVSPAGSVLDPEDVRLVEQGVLTALRDAAVAGDWPAHRRALDRVEEAYPADPAVRVHGLLFGRGLPSQVGALTVTREMNPDGESELLAIALSAEHAGATSIALVAREAVVALHPARMDYRVGLAEARMSVHGPAEAVAACRGGLAGKAVAPPVEGTAPHDAPDVLPRADLRFHLGWYLARMGEHDASATAYEKAWTLYEAMGRPKETGDAMNNAGVSLVEGSRPATAVAVLKRALRLRGVVGAAGKVATTRYNLGRALSDSGRPRDSLGAYETSAEEYRAAGRLDDARETLVETLALHADLGNRRDLERTASELLAEVEGRREPPLEADVWFELGAGRMAFADHEGALDAFARAAAGYRSVGRRLEEAQSTYSMATPHVALFRFVEAHADLIAALRIAVDLSDTASVVAIRTQLVQVRDLIRMRSAEPPPIPEELRSLVEP